MKHDTKPEAITAETLNAHLRAGGVVQITTYTKSTLYTSKHAGWFIDGKDGAVYVRHGRGKVCIVEGGRALVGIRFGVVKKGA